MQLRPRFTLASLFALLTLVAVVMGYLTAAERQRQSLASLRAANRGAVVWYGHEVDQAGDRQREHWLAHNLGPDLVSSPARVELPYATDADVECLVRLPSVRWLYLDRAIDLTDDGVARLRKLPRLKYLFLSNADRLTDRGLQELSRLKSLRTLHLELSRQMTGEGLMHLAGLSSLERLELYVPPASGSYADGPSIADAIAALQAALPHCRMRVIAGPPRRKAYLSRGSAPAAPPDDYPLHHVFTLDADGVPLGAAYGRVQLIGLTVRKAEEAVQAQVAKTTPGAKAAVALVSYAPIAEVKVGEQPAPRGTSLDVLSREEAERRGLPTPAADGDDLFRERE